MPRSATYLATSFIGLVGVGVDAQENDALLAEFAIELVQPRHVEVAHGAVVSQEDEHDRLPALITIERVRPTRLDVFEREIGQALHQAAIDRQFGWFVGLVPPWRREPRRSTQ